MELTNKDVIDIGDEDYNRVMAGLEEAKAIMAGQAEPARVHQVVVPDVDVKAIRAQLHMTQADFANRFGFSLGALRDWEQDRKKPERSNRLLLAIIQRRPDIVDEVLAA